MTEYWLQKKTIGGWSHVTWYAEFEQAKFNYDKASAGNSGYSWRLVKCETVEEKLLVDATPVEAPNVVIEKAKSNVWAGQSGQIELKSSLNEFKNPSPWDNISSGEIIETKEHGMVGKVWMLNHSTKQRARVNASEVDSMTAQGYVRGGPKTKFEG